MTFTTRAVDRDGVRLATRDFGGQGPALVLMHGAGSDQGALEQVARLLTGFRVVTFDFRGHGQSGVAPWTVADAVQDLVAVVAAYGLQDPAVGGHSLGGVVAMAYAAEHPSCPAVINIDGHGRGRVDQYVGLTPAQVHEGWARQQQKLDRLTSGVVARVVGVVLRLMKQPLVSAGTARQTLAASEGVDHAALYARIGCPLLVFNAVAKETSPLKRRLAGSGLVLAAAYRQGLGRDLAELAAARDGVEVATVDATHVLVRTHPALVAERIAAFLQRTTVS